MKTQHLNLKIFLIVLSYLLIISCSTPILYNKSQFESINNKNSDEKIKIYFNILSEIRNSDIDKYFELNYYQAGALAGLDKINDKKYIPLFFDALENDSPVIRQSAIGKMEFHKYTPSIPKLITIMKNDPVQQIQFDAISALTNLKSTSACTYLVKSIKSNNKTQYIKRTLNALIDISCPQTIPLLLNYFTQNKFNQLNQDLQYEIVTLLPKTKSKKFTPYLIKLTQPIKKLNASNDVIHFINSAPWIIELEALYQLKEKQFFIDELKGSYNSQYKRIIVKYILKFNTPETDNLIMNYINTITDSTNRRLTYISIEKQLQNTLRRQPFVEKFISNYENEKNEKIKDKLIFLLEGIAQEKHIDKLKSFFIQEKDNGDKCNILLVLSKIPSKKHYNFMLKFDNKDELSWCRVASHEYKRLITKTSLK